MTAVEGRVVYDFVVKTRPRAILELGFSHGVSTCYLAAALQETGPDGRIVTMDLDTARENEPNLTTLLKRVGVESLVTPVYAHSSYVWELMRLIEAQTVDGVCRPCFDFCFIDGAHTWAVDGLAFFLVDKLLKPGGWILFDDLAWNIHDHYPNAEYARQLSDDERRTAQVGKIFDLLVRQHSGYGNLHVSSSWGLGWGWAQKEPRPQDAEIIAAIYSSQPLKARLRVAGRSFRRTLRQSR